VLRRVPGHGALGGKCWLSDHQQQQLVERASKGEFRTYEEARRWVKEAWGVEYAYKGIYAVLARLEVRPKVPRPTAAATHNNNIININITQAREAWKKGGS
jgi:transposase